MKSIHKTFIGLLLMLAGCTVSNDTLYRRAIADAAKAQPKDIYNHLISIDTKDTSKILVCTWTGSSKYYPLSGSHPTGCYNIWVFKSEDLLQKLAADKGTDQNLRLKQLLGLPPTAQCDTFVEFWVKPTDLFRPCPDYKIDDTICQLNFPEGTPYLHKKWFKGQWGVSFFGNQSLDKYPWTQLGYTYDWNPENKSHIGVSEFVIYTHHNIEVKGKYATKEYLTRLP